MRYIALPFVIAFLLGALVVFGIWWFMTATTNEPVVTGEVVTEPAVPETSVCQDRRHTAVAGDILTALSVREFGRYVNPMLGALAIGEASGMEIGSLSDLDKIQVGQTLTIPCCLCNIAMLSTRLETVVGQSRRVVKEVRELSSEPPPTYLTRPPEVAENPKQKEIEDKVVEPDSDTNIKINIRIGENGAIEVEQGEAGQVQDEPLPPPTEPQAPTFQQNLQEVEEVLPEPAIAASEPVDSLVEEGIYSLELLPGKVNGLRAGMFPAILLGNPDDKGRWRMRERSQVAVESVGGADNFRITFPWRGGAASTTALGFDLGDGNLVLIDGYTVAKDGVVLGGASLPQSNFSGQDYATLNASFPGRTGVLRKTVNIIVPTAIQTGIGFLGGGPIGAAIAAPISAFEAIFSRKE